MKKLILLLSFIAVNILMTAQIQKINLPNSQSKIEITESNSDFLKIQFSYDNLQYLSIDSSTGKFEEFFIPQAYHIGKLGEPKLPAYNKLIEIPFKGEAIVKVLNYTETIINLKDFGIENQVFPMQPSLPKNVNCSLTSK